MALQFYDYKYESKDGVILMVRMSQQAAAAVSANTEPSGALDVPLRVKQSASAREAGLSIRKIVGLRTTGTGEALKTFYTEIPKLTEASVVNLGDTFSFNGHTWSVARIDPEIPDTFKPAPGNVT